MGFSWWMWKNIYISPRPRHRSHITSGPHVFVACLALTPSSPFWIKPSTLSNVSNRGLQLIFVTRPHTIPWTGDYPVKLVFQCMDFALHVTLGTCKINIDVSHNSSTSNHYVVLNYSRDNTETSGSSRTRADTPSHNCVKDHVTHGSTRITKLTSVYSQEMHMSFTRSQKDPDDETLEIHMKFKVSWWYRVNWATHNDEVIFPAVSLGVLMKCRRWSEHSTDRMWSLFSRSRRWKGFECEIQSRL